MLKCWSEFPGYDDFVREKWESFSVQGWGSFVLKQKLKMIKKGLKEWHPKHSKNMEGKISEVKDRIAHLDLKGEVVALLDDEVKELHGLSVNLHSVARVQTSINWQKSRRIGYRKGTRTQQNFMVLCLLVSVTPRNPNIKISVYYQS